MSGERLDLAAIERRHGRCASRHIVARRAEVEPTMVALAESAEDVPALLAEVRRLTESRDAARSVADFHEAEMSTERAARLRAEAALAEVRALADPADRCSGCPPEGWTHDGWSIRLDVLAEFRAVLDRHQGGEA